MSVNALREILSAAAYSPHTAELIGRSSLRHALSPAAGSFVQRFIAEKEGNRWGIRWAKLIPDEPWPKDTLAQYKKLDNEERAEILAFCTFNLHEITHHIDFLTTPFGTNFHGKAVREYISLQRLAPDLMKYANTALVRPLVSFAPPPGLGRDSPLVRGWNAFRGIVYFFDALRGAHQTCVTRGWGSRTDPFHLLTQDFNKVTVHTFMPSIEIPGHEKEYLRPTVIFEARALANCLRHLLHLLGGGDFAKAELVRYLNTFYARGDVDPDYTFLFDLYARLWGHNHLSELVTNLPPEQIENVFMVISAVGWYALQAPPPMDMNSLFHSSPTARLLYVLSKTESLFAGGVRKQYESACDFLAEIDRDERAGAMFFREIEETLTFTLSFLRNVREMNQTENENDLLRQHFNHLLDSQIWQIGKRVSNGYASLLGMPERGNPLLGVDEDTDADQLLFDYKPGEAVRSWFTFRENLLFKSVPSSEQKKSELGNIFGSGRTI